MDTLTEQGLDYLTRERRRVQNLLQGKVSFAVSLPLITVLVGHSPCRQYLLLLRLEVDHSSFVLRDWSVIFYP